MSARFISASSQFLENATPPLTAVPFSVGFWFSTFNVLTGGVMWSLGSTVSATNFLRISFTDLDLYIEANAGAGNSAAATTQAVVDNVWYYVVARCGSITNRRIDILDSSTGLTLTGIDTASRSPTVSRMGIGCNDLSIRDNFIDGSIAEYWMANSDIQAGGAQLKDSTLRQLAYGGPFSVPHIRKDLVEYHSFKHNLSSNNFDGENDVTPLLGETLTNNNSVLLGPHPPLPYWHASPKDCSTTLIV